MKRIKTFSNEEQVQINLAKENLTEITPLRRHLERLAAAERKEANKLEGCSYPRVKLSPLNGNGCKPRGTSPRPSIKMCRLIDELRAIREEIMATEIKLNCILNAIWKMPTKKYQDILIKKYVANIVLSGNDRLIRFRYLDAACLEFFRIYCGY